MWNVGLWVIVSYWLGGLIRWWIFFMVRCMFRVLLFLRLISSMLLVLIELLVLVIW